MDLKAIDILLRAINESASDVYIVAGCPLAYKINGEITNLSEEKLTHIDTSRIVNEIYEIYENGNVDKLMETGDADFSFALSGLGRFRCNAYKQRGSLAAVLRVVRFELPDSKELNIPDTVIKMSNFQKGLVLVTGPTGSGKSTTLACIIDEINRSLHKHIITIEDPIEFIHQHKNNSQNSSKCIPFHYAYNCS